MDIQQKPGAARRQVEPPHPTRSYITGGDGIPVVPAFEFTGAGGGRLLIFYCGFCRHTHIHGRGDGHRQAHCDVATSPFHATGYSLLTVAALPAWCCSGGQPKWRLSVAEVARLDELAAELLASLSGSGPLGLRP